MVSSERFEVKKVKEIGEIQVIKPISTGISLPSRTPRSPFSFLTETLRSISKLFISQPKEKPVEFHDFVSAKLIPELNSTHRKNGIASLLMQSLSDYRRTNKKYFGSYSSQKEPLFLLQYKYADFDLSMITWNTLTSNYYLEKVILNGFGTNYLKTRKLIFEDYVGMHFADLEREKLVIERDIKGVKFYCLLSAHHEADKARSFYRKQKKTLDRLLVINYCPYEMSHAIEHYGPQEKLMSTETNDLSEKDILAVRKSIVDSIIRNGFDVAKRKYTHPFALEILNELESMNDDQLFNYSIELSEQTLPYYKIN